MAIYDFKEFLTIDDVAEYLRDKSIHNFDLCESYDRCELKRFIWDLAFSGKLTPVFNYYGLAYDLTDEKIKIF